MIKKFFISNTLFFGALQTTFNLLIFISHIHRKCYIKLEVTIPEANGPMKEHKYCKRPKVFETGFIISIFMQSFYLFCIRQLAVVQNHNKEISQVFVILSKNLRFFPILEALWFLEQCCPIKICDLPNLNILIATLKR